MRNLTILCIHILILIYTHAEGEVNLKRKKQGGENRIIREVTVVNESSLFDGQRESLDKALGRLNLYYEICMIPYKGDMKNLPLSNWRSFENVGNYHGEPRLCNLERLK